MFEEASQSERRSALDIIAVYELLRNHAAYFKRMRHNANGFHETCHCNVLVALRANQVERPLSSQGS